MAAVRQATLDELVRVGYGRLSIDGIARRAGVARTTVYRHWDDLPALVVDALGSLHRQPPPSEADTPRERVRQLLLHLVEVTNDPLHAAVNAALVDGGRRDPHLAELLHRGSDRRRAALVAAVAAAVPGVDAELAAVALAGAVFYRGLLTATPLRAEEVDGLIDVVLGPE